MATATAKARRPKGETKKSPKTENKVPNSSPQLGTRIGHLSDLETSCQKRVWHSSSVGAVSPEVQA